MPGPRVLVPPYWAVGFDPEIFLLLPTPIASKTMVFLKLVKEDQTKDWILSLSAQDVY